MNVYTDDLRGNVDNLGGGHITGNCEKNGHVASEVQLFERANGNAL